MLHRVLWEANVEATSMIDAAEKADALQRAENGPPKSFEVFDDQGKFEPIVLSPKVPEERDPNEVEVENMFRDTAIDMYGSDDVNIDADAVVSIGEYGAFVQAWVWVRDYEAGLEVED